MFMKRSISLAAVLAAVSLASACGQNAQDEPAANASAESAAGAAIESTAAAAPAALPRTPSPEGAMVFFVSPADGDTVSNPVHVEFGIEGMSVVPAGDMTEHSGHHHLIVDADLPDMSMPVPANEHYIHFGTGATSTDLTLEPGQHTLQLILGDYMHIPHDPPVISDRISITVE